jgi:hypothetical protein
MTSALPAAMTLGRRGAEVEADVDELGAVAVHLAELGHVAGDEALERELGAAAPPQCSRGAWIGGPTWPGPLGPFERAQAITSIQRILTVAAEHARIALLYRANDFGNTRYRHASAWVLLPVHHAHRRKRHGRGGVVAWRHIESKPQQRGERTCACGVAVQEHIDEATASYRKAASARRTRAVVNESLRKLHPIGEPRSARAIGLRGDTRDEASGGLLVHVGRASSCKPRRDGWRIERLRRRAQRQRGRLEDD